MKYRYAWVGPIAFAFWPRRWNFGFGVDFGGSAHITVGPCSVRVVFGPHAKPGKGCGATPI